MRIRTYHIYLSSGQHFPVTAAGYRFEEGQLHFVDDAGNLKAEVFVQAEHIAAIVPADVMEAAAPAPKRPKPAPAPPPAPGGTTVGGQYENNDDWWLAG